MATYAWKDGGGREDTARHSWLQRQAHSQRLQVQSLKFSSTFITNTLFYLKQTDCSRARGAPQGRVRLPGAVQDPEPAQEDPDRVLPVVRHLRRLLRAHAQQQRQGIHLHLLLPGKRYCWLFKISRLTLKHSFLAMEFPAISLAIFCLIKAGRRITLMLLFGTCGLSLVLTYIVPE